MSMTCPRCAFRASRLITSRNAIQRSLRQTQQARRWQSTEAAATVNLIAVNPKIDGIVDQIGKLTLLETADLIKSLKVSPLFNSTSAVYDTHMLL
jgi:transcriptional regulator NrdR family protein